MNKDIQVKTCDYCGEYEHDCNCLDSKRISKNESELSQLREDKERLDWMLNNPDEVFYILNQLGIQGRPTAITFRTAIDSAIEQTTVKGRSS